MYPRTNSDWLTTGLDAWALGLEASMVVGMRMTRLSLGGDAGRREAMLMVSEKVGAGLELQAALLSEGADLTPLTATRKALRHYRGKVAANRKRLSR